MDPKSACLRRHRHIVFCCWDFAIGGVGTYTLNVGRALRRRGHKVTALVPEPFGELYREFHENLDHVEIVRRGVESRDYYLRRLRQRIEALRPDVLINSAVPMVQAVMPFLSASIMRLSIVHSIMAHEPKIALANGAWVDWVVAVSDNVREKIERQNVAEVKVVTIPVGLEVPPETRRQEKAANPLRLICVGRISPEKNPSGLLRVLSSLYEQGIPFSMTIVGDGPELESVRAEAASSRFGRQVSFPGSRPSREVARLLEEHDFFLLTSHFEGTPHAVLEAMAHGLVVVASRIPGSTDRIITHGVDGYLCDKDVPEEYAAALRRVSSDPAEFAAISSAAHRSVLSRYSADAIAAQYESLFEDRMVRTKTAVRDLNGSIQIPPDLLLNFPGTVFQAKHRAADIWRRVAHGRRPVPPEYGK